MELAALQIREFHILNGEVRPSGPYIATAYAKELGPASAFVVVEPVGTADEALVEQAIDAFVRSFQRQNLSLTGAILRCLEAMQDGLLDWNRVSLRDQRAGLGVSCLVVRGGEAYLAQTGPAIAYMKTGATFRRFVSDAAKSPLGYVDRVDPLLSRQTLTAGEVVVLASSSLSDRGNDEISSALSLSPDEAVHRLQALAVGPSPCAVLLIAMPTSQLARRFE
jgi:hypothetical protein